MSQRQPVVLVSVVLLGLSAVNAPARAQGPPRLDLGGSIEVGGEAERYLRVLQLAGLTRLTPWSIQPFSPTEALSFRATGPHPWSARFDGDRVAPRLLRPKARLIENSSFPFQDGGGPTWAGRGFTGEIQAGVAGSWKDLYVQVAPLAFATQNAAFPLAANGLPADGRFADPRFPGSIDAPQRFGDRAYSQVDAGTSSLSLDTRGLLLGITSAPQRWGPAREYPLVLGPTAGGFPSLYLGTSDPVDLWLFRAHVRLLYGDLGQSAFAAPVGGERRRLGSGLVATVTPRGLPGLELGGTRFIHQPWPEGGLTLSQLRRPVSGGLNISGNAENLAAENQVASLFARFAMPAARMEVYGELYREDFPGHFHQALSLIEKPDDLAAFTIGFQRVLSLGNQRVRVVRAELVNGETSHQERNERGFVAPLPPYVHSSVTQGHTVNGRILGSPEAYAGAAWRVGFDEFSTGGRRTISLERSLRLDWLPTAPVTPLHPDVVYAVRAEILRFSGAREYGITLIPAIDFNRNLTARNDVFNLAASVTVRGWP